MNQILFGYIFTGTIVFAKYYFLYLSMVDSLSTIVAQNLEDITMPQKIFHKKTE